MAIAALEESYLEVLVYGNGQWREEKRGGERQDGGVCCVENHAYVIARHI